MNSRATAESIRPAALAPVEVRGFAPADRVRWDEFVHRCVDATFFHRIGWKEVIEECFGHPTHFLLAERDAQIVGVLPLAEVKSFLFGHALVSLPFCAYGGVAADEDEAVSALHTAARRLGKDLGVEHLELRNRVVREADWPRQDLYVTFRKAILPDAESNLSAIPRKQRAMIRKGIGHGLTSRIDDDAGDFFRLYADNMHRQGTPPLARRYFETLRDVDAARDLAANDFKYWELLRRACERGLGIFDYGRSKQGTGAFDFKKHWGWEPTPLAYEYQLYRRERIPEHNPLNPKYRMLIALWKQLPIPVANAVGPHLVKSLG